MTLTNILILKKVHFLGEVEKNTVMPKRTHYFTHISCIFYMLFVINIILNLSS